MIGAAYLPLYVKCVVWNKQAVLSECRFVVPSSGTRTFQYPISSQLPSYLSARRLLTSALSKSLMRYAPSQHGQWSSEKLVLLVDADIDVREGLSELLQAKGYTVLQAENGRKALDS